LIRRIWRLLDRYSIVFTAERRIGKTTVMQKMRDEPQEGYIVRYLDLEKVDTPLRFVEVLLQVVGECLPKTERARHSAMALWKAIGGTEIGGVVKLPECGKHAWQPCLEKTIACLCEIHPDDKILLLFDELPYMLQKINVKETDAGGTDNAALAILDSLRAMRMEHANLRMVYTGSIGLHHVVDSLRAGKYASQPTNEMEVVEIAPLAQADAIELAILLLKEEQILCDSVDDVAAALMEATDCVPFYIERLVMHMFDETKVTAEIVQQHVARNMTNDNDPWEMEHFRQRIPIYYPGELDVGDRKMITHKEIVEKLLDVLAVSGEALSIDAIHGALKARLPVEDRDLVIDLLRKLSQDHYLICDADKHYSYRFPLIRKWWVLARGLN